MSTDKPLTHSTGPVAPEPTDGAVDPDNQYQDIIGEVPSDGTSSVAKKTKPGGIEPDNQYQD